MASKIPLSDYMESRPPNSYTQDRSNMHKLIKRKLKESKYKVKQVGNFKVMYVDPEALDRAIFGAPINSEEVNE